MHYKNRVLTIFGILMLIVLTACGTTDTREEGNTNDTTDTSEEIHEDVKNDIDDDDDMITTTDSENNEMDAQFEKLNFSDVEIDVSYGEEKDFEASLERDDDDNRIEAEVEDDLNNVFLEGREAFDFLFPKLEALDITSESNEEDVIKQVLNAFDLSDDYKEFDIEIQFNDGSRIDFEHRK